MFTERDEVVAMVFVVVVDVSALSCLVLLGDMVDIIDGVVAEGTFAEVELFVICCVFVF